MSISPQHPQEIVLPTLPVFQGAAVSSECFSQSTRERSGAEEISDRLLTLKTVFLLAISSLTRVGDLQALSVAPSYLDFAPGLAKVFLYPRAGYVRKVPSSTPRPVVLQAFCPPPFREPYQQRLNCMCPVLPALNELCFLLSHQWMFEPFVNIFVKNVHESLSCWKCKKMDHTFNAGKGSKMQKTYIYSFKCLICKKKHLYCGWINNRSFFWSP